jgi:hypothetical protein
VESRIFIGKGDLGIKVVAMATIVRDIESGKVYVLIGTSYTYYKDSGPSFLSGDLFARNERVFCLAALSDERGMMRWLPTEQLKVVEVNGVKVDDVLAGYKRKNSL